MMMIRLVESNDDDQTYEHDEMMIIRLVESDDDDDNQTGGR